MFPAQAGDATIAPVLKAELAGKLSGEDPSRLRERLEDALTSNVFGGLLYADAIDLLVRWFGLAMNRRGDKIACQIPSGDLETEVHFWPRMPSSGVRREPDVLVILHGTADELAICVEAKLNSGLSDGETAKDDSNDAGLLGEQLPDQFFLLKKGVVVSREGTRLALPAPDRRLLVFLTRDWCLPEGIFDGCIEKNRSMATDMYWLGWHSLPPLLPSVASTNSPGHPGRAILLRDLHLLLLRKGLALRVFDGLHELPAGPSAHGPTWPKNWLHENDHQRPFTFAELPPGPTVCSCNPWLEDCDAR